MEKRHNRLVEIVDVLKVANAATIKELSERLNVSEMTIRRDLNQLARDNIVQLLHGAAVYNRHRQDGDTGHDREEVYDLSAETARMSDQKRRIAARAVQLIQPNDVIALDSGTSTEFMARVLPVDYGLTVLCYSLNVLVQVQKRKGVKIVFAGGYYHENTLIFESQEGVELIRRNRLMKAFMAAGGINESLGVTCTSRHVVDNKRAVMDSSLKKIILADSSKFGAVKGSYYADLDEFDTIITDDGITPEHETIIKNHGTELIIA